LVTGIATNVAIVGVVVDVIINGTKLSRITHHL
jgi:hypothetical protein